MKMKLTWMLFGFVVAMCLVVGIAVSRPNAEGGYGIANASHRAMLCTGSQQDDGFVRVLGCLMGLFQLSFLVGCLVLGLRCLKSWRALAGVFIVGAVIYMAVFLLIVAFDLKNVPRQTPAMILGFPAATAIMLFVFWPMPLYFIVVYAATFWHWVITRDDMQRFQAWMVVRSRRREHEN